MKGNLLRQRIWDGGKAFGNSAIQNTKTTVTNVTSRINTFRSNTRHTLGQVQQFRQQLKATRGLPRQQAWDGIKVFGNRAVQNTKTTVANVTNGTKALWSTTKPASGVGKVAKAAGPALALVGGAVDIVDGVKGLWGNGKDISGDEISKPMAAAKFGVGLLSVGGVIALGLAAPFALPVMAVAGVLSAGLWAYQERESIANAGKALLNNVKNAGQWVGKVMNAPQPEPSDSLAPEPQRAPYAPSATPYTYTGTAGSETISASETPTPDTPSED